MPVNDDESVIAIIEKEGFTDPAQIRLSLLPKLNPGANSGMNKQIVAEAARIDESSEELDVACRDHAPDLGYGRCIVQQCNLLWIGTVALKALRTAKPKPARNQLRLSSGDPQKDLFMVAEQEDRSDPGMAVRSEPLDHVGRTRSPVDKVAEEYEEGLRSRLSLDLAMDLLQ